MIMPRQIFRNRVIASAGPLPGQFTIDNLKQWTKLRKGTYTDDFDENVTHLLCTREQFNARIPRIKEGLKRKKLHIVHYDWFEFSAVKEKRLPELEFSMREIIAQQRAKRRERERLERGRIEGIRAVNSTMFRIYRDREYFTYQVDITRNDEASGELGQRYTLYLWESNAKPHLYWFVAKFLKRKGSSQPSYYRPSSCSGKWREQMDYFMEFFRIKTGIEWQDRVLKQSTLPGCYFQYTPPVGGKPVGRRLRFSYDYCLQVNAEMRGLPPPSNDGKTPTAMLAAQEVEDDAQNADAEEQDASQGDEGEEGASNDPDDPSFDAYHFDFNTVGPQSMPSDSMPENSSDSRYKKDCSGCYMALDQIE